MPAARVEQYGSRHFAVYRGDDLIAVTVYRKGAERVALELNRAFASITPASIEDGICREASL